MAGNHDVSTPEGRNETRLEQLDRNWSDLLQEVRVAQTGVQLLTGLLLTLPFQARFATLSRALHLVYLVTLSLAVGSTALLIAPVSLHRALFRQRARDSLVAAGHLLALSGIGLLGLAVVGLTSLIFQTVLGRHAGLIAGGCALAVLGGLWGLLPWLLRRRWGARATGSG
jgi:hypothetical protein